MTAQQYKRTPKGLSVRMYSGICKRSKAKGWTVPFTKSDFDVWLLFQATYISLFDNWVKSGYSKEMVPSIDRIDSTSPYTLANMQLMTWQSNNAKGRKEERNSYKRAIAKLSEDGEILETFISIKDAAAHVNGYSTAIRNACLGTYPIAFGFKWKYL